MNTGDVLGCHFYLPSRGPIMKRMGLSTHATVGRLGLWKASGQVSIRSAELKSRLELGGFKLGPGLGPGLRIGHWHWHWHVFGLPLKSLPTTYDLGPHTDHKVQYLPT